MAAVHIELSKEFGKCLERVFFPDFDSYLMAFDRKKMGVEGNERFALIWKPRKTIEDVPKTHIEAVGAEWKSLRLKFLNACINFEPNSHPYIGKIIDSDVQRQDAYDWEDSFLVPWDRKLGLGEARDLVRKVAYHHNIDPLPKVSKGKGEVDENGKIFSEYVDGNIHLANLTLMHTIHESAHMVIANGEYGDELYTSHGPVFVWKLISLYHHYANIPLDYMISTARDHELLGDFSYHKMSTPKSMVRSP